MKKTQKKLNVVQLGSCARDSITGFWGTVVCVSYWLHGCVRVSLQPEKLNKDGSVPACETFDLDQVYPWHRPATKPSSARKRNTRS